LNECAVCGMKIVDGNIDLCAKHMEAYRKVKDAYALWFHAYGNLTTEDFLKRLESLPETGSRAREITRFLIGNPERWK
jgi:hypothetical protein